MKNWYDCTTEQQIERCENVVRVLKGLSPHERRRHWDMSTWGVPTDCGTIACAAGHCGLDPWFRKRGLILSRVKNSNFSFSNSVVFFFGSFTSITSVFMDSTPRPVSQVIKEIKMCIKDLKEIL